MALDQINYLQANLNQFRSIDAETALRLEASYRPDYPEIKQSKDGQPVPVVNRKTVHSTYNPIAEARQWVGSLVMDDTPSQLYIVAGLGFGYHLTELLNRVSADRIIVIEKDTALAAAAMTHRHPDNFPSGIRYILGENLTTACEKLEAIRKDSGCEFVLLKHPASNNLFPEYYSTLEGMLRVQKHAQHGGYKILLVSPMYGGSLPITYHVHRALNSLGHRCELLDNTAFYPGYRHLQNVTTQKQHLDQLQAGLTNLMAETVTARALEMQADLVLVMAQGPATVEVLKELQKSDIRTAFWFVEDGNILQYWRAIAPFVDTFFVIQRDEFYDKLAAVGCNNPYYLPMAADPDVHKPLTLTSEESAEFGSDLSHVGAGYFNRREFFAGLLDLDFKLWGSDWENSGPLERVLQRSGERISTEDSVKIFNATRININLHSSTYHSGINPFGDYLNPRTYEIAACGGFQLVDERQYLTENFVIGEEVVTFANLNEMRELAHEYLANPEARLQFATASRNRVLAQHTYKHRMLEMLGVLAARFPGWIPRGGGLPTAEELIREAGINSELGQVMQRFVGRGPLTLEGVAGEIEKEEGVMSRTEAMILLLNEFRRWGLEKGVI